MNFGKLCLGKPQLGNLCPWKTCSHLGQVTRNFWRRYGSLIFLMLAPGLVRHLWVWKISPRIPNFSIFYLLVKKNLIKKYFCKSWVGPIFNLGQRHDLSLGPSSSIYTNQTTYLCTYLCPCFTRELRHQSPPNFVQIPHRLREGSLHKYDPPTQPP